MTSNLTLYRRNLPHWRLDGSVYFITWRLHESQPELVAAERDVVVAALRYFRDQHYDLLAFVVMNDHVHVLVQPRNAFRLRDIMHSWKSFTARVLQQDFQRRGTIWQAESFDRIVRDENELLEKGQYILNNPLKRWPELNEYPWVGTQ